MGGTQTEQRLQRQLDERETVTNLAEQMLAEVEKRDDPTMSEIETSQMTAYRERAAALDEEIANLSEAVAADKKAIEQSRMIRRSLMGAGDDITDEGDGVVYRTMAAFARDYLITRQTPEASKIAANLGDKEEIRRAEERLNLLKRVPANTLSSNVAGLTPAQHIDQIFQVIQTSRPIVASAQHADLVRGQLTYPSVDTSPVVAVQGTQKTEAGNTGMAVSMVTATASTYLGGGDLSWQAINWSTPNALDLWFRLAAADYALKTEQDAAQALQHSAFSNNISSTIGGTPTFAELMTAIGAGGGEVYANSGRLANTLYVAPDRYWYAVGLTSNANLSFGQGGILNVNADQASLRVVVSRGMDAGVMAVGDSDGLLVAETPGAPVELRVVEPAIGGVEVGIIGAFEAVVVDDGAFAMITTAS